MGTVYLRSTTAPDATYQNLNGILTHAQLDNNMQLFLRNDVADTKEGNLTVNGALTTSGAITSGTSSLTGGGQLTLHALYGVCTIIPAATSSPTYFRSSGGGFSFQSSDTGNTTWASISNTGNVTAANFLTQSGNQVLHAGNYSSYALPLSGGTMTGAISFVSGQKYYETYTTFSSSAGSLTINCASGSVFQVTLTENVTSTTFSNAPSSGTAYGFTLRVIQGSPARTITWPAAVDWPGATAPTLSSGSGDVDVFVFFTTDGGTTWYGFTAGQDLS